MKPMRFYRVNNWPTRYAPPSVVVTIPCDSPKCGELATNFFIYDGSMFCRCHGHTSSRHPDLNGIVKISAEEALTQHIHQE